MGLKTVGIDARCMFGRRTGLGRYVEMLVDELAFQHPDVEFICYSNIPITAPSRNNVRISARSDGQPAPLWMHATLPLALRRDRVDVFWGAIGYVPCAWRPCPTVLTVHDFVYRFAGQTMKPLTRWNRAIFQRLSIKRCDRLLTVSHATAADALGLSGVGAEDVLPPLAKSSFHRVTSDRVAAVRAKYDLPVQHMITVATFEPRKNLRVLLEALIILAAEGVRLPLLVLVGDGGWRSGVEHDLSRRAETLGVARWLGYLPDEDLPPLITGASVSLFPAIYEGYGMPVVEAQACGVPVLHGDHASMVEAGGGLGLKVAPSLDAWIGVLRMLSQEQLPLVCRLPADIDQDIRQMADRMWRHLNFDGVTGVGGSAR